jgi:hypothetical protein
MIDWLQTTWDLFLAWIKSYWTDFTNFLNDFPITVLDGFLSAVSGLINAIPSPDLLQNNGLSSAVAALDPSVQYFLSQSGLSTGLSILGAGVVFRLTRKVLTLFQW